MIDTAGFDSPLGRLLLEADDVAITKVEFKEDLTVTTAPASRVLQQCITELNEYFNGKRKVFSVPVHAIGTDFQQMVWAQLLTIPFSKTISYADLAKQLGDPKVIRAAGTANSKNPVAIIIPCHRVIGSDGSLTGYAGGLWRKKWLLDFERKWHQVELF